MASRSCSPVTFVDTCSDGFYFKVEAAERDVAADCFDISKCCLSYWFRSKTNKFLLLNGEQQFQVQNLTSQQLLHPECKFKIQAYSDVKCASQPECKFRIQASSDVKYASGEERKAVMVYVTKDGKNMVACCRQGTEIYPEEMEALPSHIQGTKHKALFFLTELTASHMYQFESSEYPTRFLGFQPDGENPSLNKLVLRAKAEDDVDVSCQVMLYN